MDPCFIQTFLAIILSLGFTAYSIQVKSCRDPGTPQRGSKNGKLQVGQTLQFSCAPCHQLKGSSTRTCLSDLTWSGRQPTCTAVFCSSLQHLRNGKMSVYSRFCGGRATKFRCFPGYQLTGSGRIICQSDGTWSAAAPTCVAVRCSLLQNPTNGYLTSNSQKYDSIVQYHCDYGYQLRGTPLRHCQSNGTWSGNEPVCEIKSCADPGTPDKGSKNGKLQVGQTLRFSCAQCYQLRGSSTRTCLSDLTWSGHEATCIAVRCSTLQHPRYGRIVSYSKSCGGKPTEFMCYSGYQLIGSRRIICQGDGKWSAATPTCVVARSTVMATATPTIYSATSAPSFDQFRTTVAATSPCGNPVLPPKATIRLLRSNVLWIQCKENYVTVETGLLLCAENIWRSERELSCKAKSCRDPGFPRNGYKNGLSYFVGDFVTFTCDDCYRLVGHSMRTCLTDGSWSYTQPRCVLITCPPPQDTNQAIVSYSSRTCNAAATYTCKDTRQAMVGSGRKICNKTGKWEGAEPQCIRKSCRNPGTPRNGNKHGLSYFVGNVVTFTCDDCYHLIGHSTRMCLTNGRWSYTQPRCVLITCPPLQGTNQTIVFYSSQTCNAVARYTCTEGWIMVNSGKKICSQAGKWEGAEPQCITSNPNIAFRKPVSMSSRWRVFSGPVGVVVDGNRGGRSATTLYESRAWFKIDLLKEDAVSTVIVVNRRDCCIARINGFKVSVGNNDKKAVANAECGRRSKAKEGENIIQCPRTLRGRYVFVYMTRHTTMALHEVEVYRRRKTE